MNGNRLIFSRSGNRSRLYGVDPLLFPQRHVNNKYFLPKDHELPAHGLTTRMLAFDFGMSDPSLTILPYDTGFFPIEMGNNFLAEIITGISAVLPLATVPAAGALNGVQVDPSYLFNFQHTHAGNTRQWFNKNVTNGEGIGSAQEPMLFKHPALIPKGDTLTCIVQNLANANLRVQILLTGGEFA
jgi:hypothetical protein